jgi:arsenate reductase
MLTIYHNGECSKCKGALEMIQAKGIAYEMRYYLYEPPTVEELTELLSKLKIPASALIRKTEPLYLEQYEGKDLNEDEWIKILTENPILMQRPVVVNGDKAIIARPPEKVFEVL